MSIRHDRGVSGAGGSFGGMGKEALSEGFEVLDSAESAPFFMYRMGDDNSGTNYVGNPREKGGVCGRPLGEER